MRFSCSTSRWRIHRILQLISTQHNVISLSDDFALLPRAYNNTDIVSIVCRLTFYRIFVENSAHASPFANNTAKTTSGAKVESRAGPSSVFMFWAHFFVSERAGGLCSLQRGSHFVTSRLRLLNKNPGGGGANAQSLSPTRRLCIGLW